MKRRCVRKVLVSAVLAAALIFLWGCGNSQKDIQKEGKYSILRGKKITFLTSQSKFYDEYSLMAAAVKEIYGCDVEFQVVSDNEYASFLKLKLATTEVPDVFEYNCPGQNQEIEAYKYCLDLSKEPWVKRLVNPEGVKDSADGRIYAMPKAASSGYLAVYYNRKVLESCGIKTPHPKTYQEFLNILQTVKEQGNGAVPFYETNGDNWTTQIFMTCGYPAVLGDRAEEIFQKLSGNELKWTEVPEFTKVLTWYEELIQDGYVNEDQASAEYESAIEMMGRGKAAMYLTTETCASDIMAKYPGCELGAFVIPYGDRDVLTISKSVTGLFVPKDGGQTKEAKAFLEVWSLPEIQNIYFFRQGTFKAFTDTRSGKIIGCLQKLTKEYLDQGNYIYQMNDQMAEGNEILEELWKEYAKVASGEVTPKAALDNFQHKYEDYLEKTWR